MLEGNNLSTVVSNVCALGCGLFFGYVIHSWMKNESSSKSKNMDKKASEEEVFSDFGHFDTKLVLVVQNGLKMGKGKIAAQCSHASLLAYRQCSSKKPYLLKEWLSSGQRKIVVKVDNEESMLDLASKAREVGLIVSIIRDAGRTQVAEGSKTVMAVGPGKEQLIDKITGHLKLL